MNTGRVGGPDDDERSRKVRIKHSSAIVKGIAEGTIEWERDPDFGYLVAASVPGIDDDGDPAAAAALRGAGPRRRVPRAGRALQGRARRVPARLPEPQRRDRRGGFLSRLRKRRASGGNRRMAANPSPMRTRSSGFSTAPRSPTRRAAPTAWTSRSSRAGSTGAARGSTTSTCACSPTTRPSSGARGRASSRRPRSGASSPRCAPSCGTRSAPSGFRTPPSRRGGRGGSRTRRARRRSTASSTRSKATTPLAIRNRALVELVYSAGLRSQEAVDLDLADVDFEQELVHVRGKGDKERVVPLGEEASHRVALYLRRRARSSRAAPRTRSSSPRAAAGSTRARSAACSPTRTACGTPSPRTCSRAAPTCARSRSSSATARSRPRRCTATSTRAACARSTTRRIHVPDCSHYVIFLSRNG